MFMPPDFIYLYFIVILSNYNINIIKTKSLWQLSFSFLDYVIF